MVDFQVIRFPTVHVHAPPAVALKDFLSLTAA